MQVKKMIKKPIMMLGLICLSSCGGMTNQEVCEVKFAPFNNCTCFWYSFKNKGPITDPEIFPLQKCDKITGIKSNKLATELIPELKKRVRACEDLGSQ